MYALLHCNTISSFIHVSFPLRPKYVLCMLGMTFQIRIDYFDKEHYMYITLISFRVKIAGRIVAFQRCDVTVQFVMCVVKYSRL